MGTREYAIYGSKSISAHSSHNILGLGILQSTSKKIRGETLALEVDK